MVSGRKLNFGVWLATQIFGVVSYHHLLILGRVITLLAVNLHLFYPEKTDLHYIDEPKLLDQRVLDDMGLLCKVGGIFSLTPAGSVVPRN